MKFVATKLRDVYIVQLEPCEDERGFFERIFCEKEFQKQGISMRIVQSNLSGNAKRGTLRGMHYQEAPFGEDKIVLCVKGSVYDVAVDLRRESATYLQWVSVGLSVRNHCALYIPKGCAHGFQTLEDASEVLYFMSESYSPDHTRGVRWDDPAFAIQWPIASPILSERDQSFFLYER